MGELGLTGAPLPESVGGSGLGVLAQCAVLVEVGRTVAPVPYLSSIATVAPCFSGGNAAMGVATSRICV